MATKIDRKDFLRLTTLGFLASLIPHQELHALSSIFTTEGKVFNQTDFEKAVALAVTAKQHFYKQEFLEAKDLYLECIGLAPGAIRFYDALSNVYVAQGNPLAALVMYNNGHINNPGNTLFHDRLARALMSLETGNKVLADQYKNTVSSQSLLQDAESLYLSALSIEPSPYLESGLEKVRGKLNGSSALNNLSRQFTVMGRGGYPSVYDRYSEEQLLACINKIDTKPRTVLYKPADISGRARNILREKKILYRKLIHKIRVAEDFARSLSPCHILYNLDKTDSMSFSIYKRAMYGQHDYYNLVYTYKEYAALKSGFFENMGLVKATIVAYDHQAVGQNEWADALAICQQMRNEWNLPQKELGAVIDKMSLLYIQTGNYSLALSITEDYLNNMVSIDPVVIFDTIRSYAHIYYKMQDYTSAIRILTLGLSYNVDDTAVGFETIAAITKTAGQSDFNRLRGLYYLLCDSYFGQGDTDSARSILTFIKMNKHDDLFVAKRLNL